MAKTTSGGPSNQHEPVEVVGEPGPGLEAAQDLATGGFVEAGAVLQVGEPDGGPPPFTLPPGWSPDPSGALGDLLADSPEQPQAPDVPAVEPEASADAGDSATPAAAEAPQPPEAQP